MAGLIVTYEVRQHPQEKDRWIVLRGGVPTGGVGPNMHLAINSAIAEARQEARTSDLKIRVVSIVGNERSEEWASEY